MRPGWKEEKIKEKTLSRLCRENSNGRKIAEVYKGKCKKRSRGRRLGKLDGETKHGGGPRVEV